MIDTIIGYINNSLSWFLGHGEAILTRSAAVLVFIAAAWYMYQQYDPYGNAADWMRTQYLDTPPDHEDWEEGIGGSVAHIVRLTVAHLRTEHGLLSDSAANRLVISHATRRYMKEHGLRPSHISTHFPIAVEVYMMRSSADEQLDKIRESHRGRRLRRLGAKTL